jgi:hypothetical protein
MSKDMEALTEQNARLLRQISKESNIKGGDEHGSQMASKMKAWIPRIEVFPMTTDAEGAFANKRRNWEKWWMKSTMVFNRRSIEKKKAELF